MSLFMSIKRPDSEIPGSIRYKLPIITTIPSIHQSVDRTIIQSSCACEL